MGARANRESKKMTFQFDSFIDFFQMAGHGVYVWLAYGVSAFILIALFLRPVAQHREIIRQAIRNAEREAAQKAAHKSNEEY